MTYSAPSTASHSFRPYQPTSAPASTVPAPSRHLYQPYPSYDYDAPQPQPAAATYRRRSEDTTHYPGKHLSAPVSSAASAASFSPLSLCSSVSSCSSSSSGSSSSAYSSPADTFDLEEDAMDDDHHQYYQHPSHPQPRHHKPSPQQLHPMAAKPSRAHSAQDGVYYAPQPAAVAGPPHMYGHASHSPPPAPMTVSIPAANGGWKDPAGAVVRRRDGHMAPAAHPILTVDPPQYMPAPMQAVVASSVSDLADGKSGSGKKKKGRSLRRCMDREKHSKAEQKRRGEMKVLFDQLQDISQCVYKDRIHILTLAIQTITRQQDAIAGLEAQVKSSRARVKAVKKELAAADTAAATTASSSPSGSSTPSSPAEGSVGSKRAAVAAEIDCEAAPVKQETEEAAASPSSPKKQRTSPQPREVVDLSAEAAFAALPPVSHHEMQSSTVSAHATHSSYASKPLHSSFSSSSLSTFVCPSAEAHHPYPYHLMDDHPHGAYPASQHADEAVAANKSQLASHVLHSTQPCESPVFSFSAHPHHWWPQPPEQPKH